MGVAQSCGVKFGPGTQREVFRTGSILEKRSYLKVELSQEKVAKCVGGVCGGPIGQHTSVPRNHVVGHLKAGVVHTQGSGSDL